jgi:putative protease
MLRRISLNKIELLAPASSFASAKLAINSGANAIYLGTHKFNARLTTTNLTIEEIAAIIKYAHIRDVRVFITINTLIFENELPEVTALIDELVSFNVDAFIIQDLGLLNYFNQVYPEVEIHASTQMNAKNLAECQFLVEHGIKRIILARETPLPEIIKIKEHLNVELEVFVQGALCSSYSGQCLISSIFEGRSGNRGICAQICRYKFDRYRDEQKTGSAYYLSTKDLCTIEHLSSLVGLVSAIKIEGRHRSDEYLYTAVHSYRTALDAIENHQTVDYTKLERQLSQVFNRSFTKGYLFNANPSQINYLAAPNNQGYQIGEVVQYHRGYATIKLSQDIRLGDGIRILSNIEYGKNVDEILLNEKSVKFASSGEIIKIPIKNICLEGDKVVKTSSKDQSLALIQFQRKEAKLLKISYVLQKRDSDIYLKTKIGNYQAERVLKSNFELPPLSIAQIEAQLRRLGNTPYEVDEIACDFSAASISLSDLNQARRENIRQIEEQKLNFTPFIKKTFIYQPVLSPISFNLACKVYTQEILDYLLKVEKIQTIYYYHKLTVSPSSKVLIPFYDRFVNPSTLSLASSFNNFIKPLDYYFNVTNSYAIDFCSRYLGSIIYLSTELNTNQIALLKEHIQNNNYHIGVIAYGMSELMIIKAKLDLQLPAEHLRIQDKKIFCRIDDNNQTILYLDAKNNYKLLAGKLAEYQNLAVSEVRLDFVQEKLPEVQKILDNFH